jgi:hypothetical protein
MIAPNAAPEKQSARNVFMVTLYLKERRMKGRRIGSDNATGAEESDDFEFVPSAGCRHLYTLHLTELRWMKADGPGRIAIRKRGFI